jgi:hypothetical protein
VRTNTEWSDSRVGIGISAATKRLALGTRLGPLPTALTQVSCDLAQLRLSLLRPPLTLLVLLISCAQSCFWAPLSLNAHTVLRKYLSLRMWKVYTTIRKGIVLGTKGSKLGLLVKTVDVISRNPRPPCKMEHIYYVASALAILLLIVARHDIHVVSFLPFRLSFLSDMPSPFCVLPQAT